MLTLQYLICGSRGFEPVISHRHQARLRSHPRLHCSAYICKSYQEFAELNALCVGKMGKRLWTAVQVLDTDTGLTSDPPADLFVSLAPPVSGPDGLVLSNPPFSGAGPDGPEKPAGGADIAGFESAPAPESHPHPPSAPPPEAPETAGGPGLSSFPPEPPADLPPPPAPTAAKSPAKQPAKKGRQPAKKKTTVQPPSTVA